jgi:hypothetical protein
VTRVHCPAGKDHTGVLAAMLLGVLGVREEEIVADYAAAGGAVRRIGPPGDTGRRRPSPSCTVQSKVPPTH